MKLITIDFETFYSKEFSLSKLTTEEYVRSPEFEIIGIGIKVDNQEPQWASGTHEQLKNWLRKEFPWSESMVLAHNTMFDGAILSWVLDVHPMGWLDTLCMGRALHGVEAGGSLKVLAERYELGEKGTEVLNAIGKRRADFTPEELSRYGDYCVNDVELTYRLFNRMVKRFPKQELKLIDLTLRMFTDPLLKLDVPVLTQHLEEIRKQKEDLLTSSGLDRETLMSNQKFAEALRSLGVEPPTKISPTTGKTTLALAKNDEEFKALEHHEDPLVQALVAARLGTKSTLEETRAQRFIEIAGRGDGTLPVPVRYYAAHTGRWGGDDKINLQNLPSRGANANKIKQSIVAPKGYSIIDADSAQIEARVLAWIAEQDDLVEAFKEGRDVYKKMASAIYNKPESEISKEERFVGKTTILGCFGADTKVLTNYGWKHIVDVQVTDMVWDGEAWVAHQGVVPKGVRETIHAWGVNATPEHEILTEHGWQEWSEVVTNPTLSQSAFNRATLPLSIGDNTVNQTDVLPDGTHLSAALVGGKVSLTDTTSRQNALQDVIHAPKILLTKLVKSIGGMKQYFQTLNTGNGCLTGLHLALADATTPKMWRTFTMGQEVFSYTNLGEKTERSFLNTYSPSMGGMTQNENSTVSTLIKGTNQTILGLLRAVKTWLTEEKSKTCKKKLMTYDIAYAGPRNRFTIATSAGPLIVHNCGYGMGALKFQTQLKAFGFNMELDEARRVIDVYRRANYDIANLWREAQLVIERLSRKEPAIVGRAGVLEVVPEESAIRLPSGLLMRYEDLQFSESEKGLEYHYKTRKGRTKIYGGKVVENFTQAIARCIIAEQMLKISKKYRVVLTVHDAITCVVRDQEVEEAQHFIETCMRWTPSWAEGLPVNCESGVAKNYGSC